ncbi:MAG TPA: flavodoxin family protein [Spirochaetia bacterium]|nr:flavodoxin family protein [Spirochaetia bacterium]
MGKLLGLVVSQRRLGNSEVLVKEIMIRVPGEWEREMIRLTDLRIEPCKACYTCLSSGVGCKVDDDFKFVMAKVQEADALVIGVPVYILGPHGYLKMFTDRLLGAGHYVQRTRGKPCVVVMPYGVTGWLGYSRAAALTLPRILQMKLADFWAVHAALPAEGALSPDNLARAGDIAARLFTGGEETRGPGECLTCGSDLFRLLPGGVVECPLCGVRSRLDPDGQLVDGGTDEGRFTPARMQEHFLGWLVDMKEKFRVERERLKEAQKPYRDMDWWVRPPERERG